MLLFLILVCTLSEEVKQLKQDLFHPENFTLYPFCLNDHCLEFNDLPWDLPRGICNDKYYCFATNAYIYFKVVGHEIYLKKPSDSYMVLPFHIQDDLKPLVNNSTRYTPEKDCFLVSYTNGQVEQLCNNHYMWNGRTCFYYRANNNSYYDLNSKYCVGNNFNGKTLFSVGKSTDQPILDTDPEFIPYQPWLLRPICISEDNCLQYDDNDPERYKRGYCNNIPSIPCFKLSSNDGTINDWFCITDSLKKIVPKVGGSCNIVSTKFLKDIPQIKVNSNTRYTPYDSCFYIGYIDGKMEKLCDSDYSIKDSNCFNYFKTVSRPKKKTYTYTYCVGQIYKGKKLSFVGNSPF